MVSSLLWVSLLSVFSSVSSFNINLWWLSCSSFMAVLDLVLSSFHFPMLDATFLSLLYSTGEYKKWQELQELSQWPVSATDVNALDKIIGDGEYKQSVLSWFRDCPKEVTSILRRLCGNGLKYAQHFTGKAISFPVGRKQRGAVSHRLQDRKQSYYQVYHRALLWS